MSKFKVGDRVVCTRDSWNKGIKGLNGTLVLVGEGWVSVEFDVNMRGHSASGFGRDGHCWNVHESHLELLHPTDHKILITTDGKTTLARLYEGEKVVKRAEAKCAPGDEFRFEIGANLAFDRLMGRVGMPEPKPEQLQDSAAERRAMVDKICKMGACTALSGKRKKDCPFFEMRKGFLGCRAYAEAHPETQKIMEDYIAAEQDKPESKPEQPKQDKPEPVKLYCVEDFCPGVGVTKGKVYEFANGKITHYDNPGLTFAPHASLDHYRLQNPTLSKCLVPLVNRPAKVGEWVYVYNADKNFSTNMYDYNYKNGDVFQAKNIRWAGSITIPHHVIPSEYLVLDGYTADTKS